MEDNLRSEKLEGLLTEVHAAKAYSKDNLTVLDKVMQKYWIIIKELNSLAPNIFNNLATNGIIDLINRSNLTDQAEVPAEKSSCYKDYWDYLSHSIKITIDYINNFLPESLAYSDAD
jgi:hypothetical protein